MIGGNHALRCAANFRKIANLRLKATRHLLKCRKNAAVIISGIAALAVQKKQIEEQEKTMRDKLRETMESYGVKSFETPEVKFLYIPATTRTTIDTARLKKAMPDVVEKYSKITNVSASVKITVK